MSESFNVKTGNNPAVKRMFVDLYKKHVGSVSFAAFDSVMPYLQVWFGSEAKIHNGITHFDIPYQPNDYPVLTLEQAIETITSHKNEVTAKLTLNDQYSAEIQPNGDVKVGCQTFTHDVVQRLASESARVKKANNL